MFVIEGNRTAIAAILKTGVNDMYEVIITNLDPSKDVPSGFNPLGNGAHMYYGLVYAESLDDGWDIMLNRLKKFPWIELNEVGEN